MKRGEAILNRLVERSGLTECGRDWLIASLDPMHDTQLKNLEGWPDLETASSVVRCVKQTFTIASNQEIGVNWDCHIVQWPFLDSLNSRHWTRTTGPSGGNRVIDTPTGAFNLGGLQIYGVVAGAVLDPTNPFQNIATELIAPAYSQGSGRLVGMGFEVVNTTADIKLQGQVTVYRQSQSNPNPIAWVTATTGGVLDPAFSGHWVRSPPTSQADAMLIPGSRQWLARDGAYVVQAFVGQDNPPKVVEYIVPIVQLTTNTEDNTGGGGTNTTPVAAPATGLVGLNACMNVATKIYPVHMSGAIFTGLSDTSTLSVTLVYYYETFPTPAEASILVLATPSAKYDPIALELFSQVLSQMPVGVPSTDNADGDWFDGIMAIVRDIAPIAAPMLAMINPALGGLGAAAGTAAGAYLTAQTPNTRPKLKKLPADDQQRKKKKVKKAMKAAKANAKVRESATKGSTAAERKQIMKRLKYLEEFDR